MEYTELTISSAAKISRESIVDSMKDILWLEYEVDPEWKRFCSFGPEDIGSVWEAIGAIRKRPRYSMAVVGELLAGKLNKQVECNLLYGIPLQVSKQLREMDGYLVCNDFSFYPPTVFWLGEPQLRSEST